MNLSESSQMVFFRVVCWLVPYSFDCSQKENNTLLYLCFSLCDLPFFLPFLINNNFICFQGFKYPYSPDNSSLHYFALIILAVS